MSIELATHLNKRQIGKNGPVTTVDQLRQHISKIEPGSTKGQKQKRRDKWLVVSNVPHPFTHKLAS
jgi:hypothetical protein